MNTYRSFQRGNFVSGQNSMQPSTSLSIPSSTKRMLPQSIKEQHNDFKRRGICKRRIDHPCGCITYLALGCQNGQYHITGLGRDSRIYLERPQSPLFQITRPPTTTILLPLGHHSHPSPVQPQPQESVGFPQVLDNMDNLDSVDSIIRQLLKED